MASNKNTAKRRSSQPQDSSRPVKRSLNETRSKHEIFTEWSQDRGVQIHNVQPCHFPGRGVGLVTTAPIEKDARILFVPEKAIFKPNFAKLKHPRVVRERATPQVQLVISLFDELQDKESPLQKWKATWPTPEELVPSLPLFWSDDMCKLLPDSALGRLERQRQDLAKDRPMLSAWKLADNPAQNTKNSKESRSDEANYYWAIVNSRSFHFKPPGAKPGFMVLCPFIDYMNHVPNGQGVNVRQTPKGYEVIANRNYDKGEEICATYGAHPNDKLLIHYGFINNDLSDDDIRLDHYLMPTLEEHTQMALQDVGFLGGYALLPASNDICFKTQVAVRANLLSSNEWEYFISTGEDMSSDQTARVRGYVIKNVLKPFLKDAEARLAETEKSEKRKTHNAEKQIALLLLKQRWTQIRDAIQAFLEKYQQPE